MLEHTTLTRMVSLGVALLLSGGCASTNLTGTLMGRPFVARGAYAQEAPRDQITVSATEYEEEVLNSKMVDEGDLILLVMLPKSATGRLNVQGKRSTAKVAAWKFSWERHSDDSFLRYGRGTVEVVTLSRTKAHLRVNVRFPGGGAVSGELVAPVDSRD